MAFEKEKLTFLAIITLSITAVYVVSLVYSLSTNQLPVKDFIAQLGPMTGMLLGYWVRDNQTPTASG